MDAQRSARVAVMGKEGRKAEGSEGAGSIVREPWQRRPRAASGEVKPQASA
jgi:hypothetical protein